MNAFDPHTLATVIIAERLRAADHERLARDLKRREQPVTAPTPAPTRSRLRGLVHFRQAWG